MKRTLKDYPFDELVDHCTDDILAEIMTGQVRRGVCSAMNLARAWASENLPPNHAGSPAQQDVKDLVQALEATVSYIESLTCTHSHTTRSGICCVVCDDCGAKWQGERGEKPSLRWPASVTRARALIERHRHQ